jgi:N-acetylglucosaminyldiphosphoundecaprenol N-acetyl-beta-D-mannosaminyltransferase
MKRIPIFGTEITVANLHTATKVLEENNFMIPRYICLPDVSVVMSALKDPSLQQILNGSFMTFPDGKPLELYARLKGESNIRTISGYWLIQYFLQSNFTHFFYGSNTESLEKIKRNINLHFPNAKVLGYKAPPFVSLQEIKDNQKIQDDMQEINDLGPDFIWIGISSPKQDYLMHGYYKVQGRGVFIGVGGVFNYLSGERKISPEWIKKIGFRWLYRLIQDPGRLWKRYLITNSKFIYLIFKELVSFNLLKRR